MNYTVPSHATFVDDGNRGGVSRPIGVASTLHQCREFAVAVLVGGKQPEGLPNQRAALRVDLDPTYVTATSPLDGVDVADGCLAKRPPCSAFRRIL